MKKNELKLITEKSMIHNEMLRKLYNMPQMNPAFEETERRIQKACQENDEKALKILNVEVDNFLKHAPKELFEEFRTKLLQRTGFDINSEMLKKQQNNKIRKLQKAGKIVKREDYDLVEAYWEEIIEDPDKKVEADNLRELLNTYSEI